MEEVQKVGRGCNGCITAGSSRNRVQVSHAQTLHDNVIPFNPAEPSKTVGRFWCRCSLNPRTTHLSLFSFLFSSIHLYFFFLLSLFSVLSYFTLFALLIELLQFDVDSWRLVPSFVFWNRTIRLEREYNIVKISQWTVLFCFLVYIQSFSLYKTFISS